MQMSLAVVKRSLAAENSSGQLGREDGSPSPHYYDSEDRNSLGTETPGRSTPIRIGNSASEVGVRQSNCKQNGVNHLAKEFEQRKQNFDEAAKAIIPVSSGHAPPANPNEELRSLKHRFETWKRDFKARLRETRAKLQKLGLSDAEKHRRRWWGGKSKKL